MLLRGAFNQGGAAFAGVLLLFIGDADNWLIPALAAALALVWLVFQRRAARAYLDNLGVALGARSLSLRDEVEPPLLGDRGIAQVIALLEDDDEESLRFSRELLSSVARDDPRALAAHLGRGPVATRRELYRLIAAHPAPSPRHGASARRRDGDRQRDLGESSPPPSPPSPTAAWSPALARSPATRAPRQSSRRRHGST